MTPEELQELVVAYYLESGDFNGLPSHTLTASHGVDPEASKALTVQLISEGRAAVNLGDVHPNPHIRAFPDPPAAEQLVRLEAHTGVYVIYPTATVLNDAVDKSQYEGRPFELRLALGEPQLKYESFDLAVIDHYRRDPRYRLWTNDVTATLSIGNEAFESEAFPEKHNVLIQHFGFSYDEDFRRAVAVFLTDLAGLTPEHQQIWAAYTVIGDYRLHPDFYRAAILGDWELKVSLRDAFVHELETINSMCSVIGWKPLFRHDIADTPKELAFLIRPTADEFNAFVMILDKLMSENLNQAFFEGVVPAEYEETLEDGRVEVRRRGTIQRLERWFAKEFRTDDPEPLRESLSTFRKIRKRRQKPAHTLTSEEYDETLFEEQRALFREAYSAVRTLRLLIQNHPAAAAVLEQMDQNVRNGEIWPI